MKYVVITDNEIIVAKNLKVVNFKLKSKIEQKSFKTLGNDFVLYLNHDNLEFVQDKKQISNQILSGLFKTDNSAKLYSIIIMIMLLVVLLQGCTGGA